MIAHQTLWLAGSAALAAVVLGGAPDHSPLPQPGQPLARIEIAAGPAARRDTPVSFPLPAGRTGASYALRSGDSDLPLQVADGVAWAVIPALAANERRGYEVVAVIKPLPGEVTAVRQGANLLFTSRGRSILQYVGGAGSLPSGDIKPVFQRGGYLHPVRTPSGRIVTGDYPPDHRHHHGVWFAWTRTAFQGREPDFWNMGDGKGRVEFEATDSSWGGPVQGGLKARHLYVDLTGGAPIAVLREEWLTRVFVAGPDAPYFLFDVEVSQANVSGAPLALPEYHYGGMAVRGAPDFVPLDNVAFLTSEGKDRKTGDAVASRWASMSGTVGGARAGIAVLAHAKNFRAPEPMRIHPTDPYMCFAPSKTGGWEIPAKGSHAARYRFVAFDGSPDAAELERLWRDYVEPPAVTVK
jgi:hypothetical protein